MEIPFIPGVFILLLFYFIFAKYWCKFADWIGELVGLKRLIEWIINKLSKRES